MGQAGRVRQVIELPQEMYDWLERQLLDAGYYDVFEAGPGSAIDLSGFRVTREDPRGGVNADQPPGVRASMEN